jgi:hypothetical protein
LLWCRHGVGIREALDQDEQELRRHNHRDPSIFKFVFSCFRGRMGWLDWMEFCFDFAFTTKLYREALV